MSTTISGSFYGTEILNIFQVPLEELTIFNYVFSVSEGSVKLTIEKLNGTSWEAIEETDVISGGGSCDGSFHVPHVKIGSPGGSKTLIKFIFNRISEDDETGYEFTYQRE